MTVRIRLPLGKPMQRKQGKNRHLALAAGAFLQPAALLAYVLGFWRLAADLGLSAHFGITGTLFSHWQVWMPVAGVAHIAAVALDRYGRGGELRVPLHVFRKAA